MLAPSSAKDAVVLSGGAFKYDPFANFFDWLRHNQTSWCVTAADFYETMLEEPGICPGMAALCGSRLS